MRRLSVVALALGLVGGLAAACGGNGPPPPPTPEGPTSLSLTKTVLETGEGEFRFTLELTNEGNNTAANVVTSDMWNEGLEVTTIGSVNGQQPAEIGHLGLEFILREFQAGGSVQVTYTARCRQSGEWENVAVASSANSEPAKDTVTVVCP